jgi:type I restriction enzyme, S subunit
VGELPKGWAQTTLANTLISYQAGFASGKKDVPGGLLHLRMNNIGSDGRLNLELLRRVPKMLAKSSHYLEAGDIVLCTTNSGKLVGKSALFTLTEKCAFSNHLTRLRVDPKVASGRFMQLHLWHLWLSGEFENRCKHWVNQSTIPKEEMLALEMVVPPLNEQRRIVAKLEQLLHRVDACKERLDKIPGILKRFRQSVLAAACSGRLTADWREQTQTTLEDWRKVTLSDVAEMRLGKMLDQAKNEGDPTPYLRNINVRWFGFDLTDVATMRATPEERKTLSIRNGDLLVCEGGEPGRCAVSNLGEMNLIFQKAIHRIRLKGDILPYWLAFNIRNDSDSGSLEDYFTGTTIKHLTGQSLRTYTFKMPIKLEQHEIVRRVEALFKKADEIEARYKKAKAFVDKLTQSILAKAFRGELVPQDPNDEPASKLLERIKSERQGPSRKNMRKRH